MLVLPKRGQNGRVGNLTFLVVNESKQQMIIIESHFEKMIRPSV